MVGIGDKAIFEPIRAAAVAAFRVQAEATLSSSVGPIRRDRLLASAFGIFSGPWQRCDPPLVLPSAALYAAEASSLSECGKEGTIASESCAQGSKRRQMQGTGRKDQGDHQHV